MKHDQVKSLNENNVMMETINFMYLCTHLMYSDKNNRIERIPVGVEYIDHLLCIASELLESDELLIFEFSHGT